MDFNIAKIKVGLIDIVADVAPWLAPIAPAYMVLVNMRDKLGFPELVAWVVAGAVETLGLASVHTALEFWRWNGERRKSDDPAPFVVAVVAILFYVMVVLTVNAVLDFTDNLFAHIFAKSMLSLLSLPAALIVALRAGHARRLAEIADDKAERKAERAEARLARSQPVGNVLERSQERSKTAQNVTETFPHLSGLVGTFPTDWRKLTSEHKSVLRDLTEEEIAHVMRMTLKSGQKYRQRLAKNGAHEPA